MRTAAQERKRNGRPRSIAAGGILGGVFAAVLVILSLLGRIELTALTEELEGIREEKRILEEEYDRLQIRFSGLLDLESLERRATEELGMQRPGPEQVSGEEGAPDRLVVFAEGQTAGSGGKKSLGERFREFFS